MSEDLTLSARALQLAAILDRCQITNVDADAMSVETGIARCMDILVSARNRASSVYIIGNGGSAGVAGHAAIDFVNVAKLRAFTLHEAALLTCMANDYGYENAFARLLSELGRPGDVLIAISSSGRSMNIRNAAAQVKGNGGAVITLSGFAGDNPLRSGGDVNIWLDSNDYGMVEIGHQFILHNMSDRLGTRPAGGSST